MTKQKYKHENSDIPISQVAYDNFFRSNRKYNKKDLDFDSFYWNEY